MERTWSQGLQQRKARRAESRSDGFRDSPMSTKTSMQGDTSLPVISPKGAGTSSRDFFGGDSGLGSLGTSASEPSLRAHRKKGSSPNRKAFLERQFAHSSIQARKDMSALHKQLIKDAKASDDVEFLGAKGVEGFRQYLEKRFGTLVAGWRALDREKTGRLSFYEFCNACRSMGYHGNLKQLWDELDVSKSGGISLMEIDKEVGHYIGTFKLECLRKWGDLLVAWKKGIDTNGTGRVEEPDIARTLSVLGLDQPPTSLNARKLLNMLRSGPKNVGMTLMDFDPEAYNRSVTGGVKAQPATAVSMDLGTDEAAREAGEEAAAAAEGDASPASPQPAGGGPRAFRAQLGEASKHKAPATREKVELKKLGMHSVEIFKAALISRCGSLLSAWREALDLDGNGRITFCEFCQAMQRLGYQADTLGLWKKLDQRSEGKVLFKDLDPETYEALLELQSVCEKAHGNMLLAWLKEMDTKGTGIVNDSQFAKACARLGYSGSAKKLFRRIQPDLQRKFITLRDFDTKAFLALSRGDFRMLSEQPDAARKTALQKTFMERQEGGWFFQIRRAWEASTRAEFTKACKTNQDWDFIIDTVEEFEDLCVRRFGSMLGAWRQVMDWDANGKITFNEFCNALRRLGYAGDFRSLWRQYDKKGVGHIALKDMDPEMDTMIGSLLNLLTERYGSIDAAWLVGFGKDPHDSCDFKELKEVCDSLGYGYDVEKLFRNLQLMPGRALITIWDLDPACNRKRQRGDVRFISTAKSGNYEGGSKRHNQSAGSGSEDAEEVGAGPSTSFATGPSTSSYSTTGRCDPELQALKQCLRIRHGSTVAAWRATLDPQMSGSVFFGKFILVLEESGFTGNVKGLWEELALGRASITLKDIDPEAVRLLDRLRSQLLSKYGSLVKAWAALDADAAGRLDQEDFIKACVESGVAVKSPKKAFQLLRARLGQRSLTIEDFTALLITLPSEKRAKVWTGVGSGGSVDGGSDEEPMPSDDELGEPSVGRSSPRAGERPWEPKEDTTSPRSRIEKASREHNEKNFKVTSLVGFKKILIRRNGSLFAAWRHVLDVDRNGVVGQHDFACACRSLGVKNIPQLWAELDTDKDGQISLRDMDPETAELFGEVERLLLEKYGTTREGWKRVFLPTGCSWCEQETFVEQCKVLGFSGDAERLYQLVKPEAGRRHLTYEDIWPNYDPNFNRPESPMEWWTRGANKDADKAGSDVGNPKASMDSPTDAR